YYGYGGGLYISYASPTLEDLVVTENEVYDNSDSTYTSGGYTYYFQYAGYGGGLYNYGGSPTLTDVEISRNRGYLGAAIYSLYGSMTGSRLRLLENHAGYYTWYAYGNTVDFDNLEVNADTSDRGISGLYSEYSTIDLTNTCLVSTDYGVYAYGSTVTLRNSAIHGVTYGVYDPNPTISAWYLTYNNVYGNGYDYYSVTDPTGTDGNLQVDPGFNAYTDDSDAVGDDLSLTRRSAMTDAGNPDAAYDDTDGSVNDIGCFGGPGGSW
ncbi:MAG: hypothetical protein Q7U06_01065, partial [Pseudomonadota bacterium]|nr:hypothetical protein [Pseudomonadota bacterium]